MKHIPMPTAIVRIKGNDPLLLDALKSDGIQAKFVSDAIVFDPKPEANGIAILPEIITNEDFTLCVVAVEAGGCKGNGGLSQVVCGMSGKALLPYYKPDTYYNAVVAHFCAPEQMIIITCDTNTGQTVIQHISVSLIPPDVFGCKFTVEKLWAGNHSQLPVDVRKYEIAVNAGWQKANCPRCVHIHYQKV